MPTSDSCTDLETLARFVGGAGAFVRREEIAGHLLECDRCFQIVCDAAEWLDELIKSQPSRT